MSHQNKFLTTLNQPLPVELYSLVKPDASPVTFTTLEGVPLGTANNGPDGEIAVKTMNVGGSPIPGFNIPKYDTIAITYYGATNNIETVVYSLGGTTVATLTLTYAGAGVADDDTLIGVVKS